MSNATVASRTVTGRELVTRFDAYGLDSIRHSEPQDKEMCYAVDDIPETVFEVRLAAEAVRVGTAAAQAA